MFGRDATANEQMSEDEDWGPDRKRRRKKNPDMSCTVNLHECKEKGSDNESPEVENKFPAEPQAKRPLFRIPPSAVEVITFAYQVQNYYLCSLPSHSLPL